MFVQTKRFSRLPRVIVVLVSSWMGMQLFIPSSAGQDLKKLPPQVAADLARSPKEQPSNEDAGIDIDRFIGNPLTSPVYVFNDVIFKRSILRHGDSYRPGDPGAVLEYWKDLSHATLLGNTRSPLAQMPDEQIWYVTGGKGRLDNGEGYWDMHEGVGVLIPPNVKHRLVNTTDESLHMIVLTYARDNKATPRRDILVRNIYSLPLPAKGAHWNYFGVNLFFPEDGLNTNEVVAVNFMPPMSIGSPHAHTPHLDEVWIKLPPHSSYLMLGSEVREMPPYTAFLAPPNAQTVHSTVNLLKEETQKWLYIAHWSWDLPPYPDRPGIAPKPLKEP